MAVYKASNCTPFLGSIDLTFGQIAQCEINSSNSTVTGYRLEILDNLNNVIFSGERFSPVPQGFRVDCIDTNATYYTNTGLNGSMLTVPLIIRGSDKGVNADIFNAIGATATGNSSKKEPSSLSEAQCSNIIYYNTDGKWYKIDVGVSDTAGTLFTYSWALGSEIPNLSNGYVNMPYKWRITLAQGQKIDTNEKTFDQQPKDSKWYDMGIAVNQQILGSTVNRIQGPYSDKILSDYFIQLGTYSDDDGDGDGKFTAKGQRVIITSYDNYGYIYPRENYITEEMLNGDGTTENPPATHFQIYKETNEEKYVNSNRMVNFATTTNIDIQINGEAPTTQFGYNQTSGYYEQVYDATETEYNAFKPFASLWGGGATSVDLTGGGTSILFMGNTTGVSDEDASKGALGTANAYNGIFIFADKVYNNGQMTLRWQRPSFADTWAEYIDQLFYVKGGTYGGRNIQSKASDMGTLNSSPLAFTDEEPIEIYSTEDLDDNDYAIGRVTTTIGAIAKNTNEDIYIRANNAVEAGQQFRYATSAENNYGYDTQIIKYVNRDLWYINPQGELKSALTPGTQYSIYSYFKGSDENPFYAYTTPEIKLNIENVNDDKNNGDTIKTQYTLASYILNATGTFSQEQNKTWRSFQWILTNRTLNYSITGEKQYSGAIEYNFSGLQDLMEYSLQLIMEDEWGNTLGVTKYFRIELGADAYDYFPVTLTFDCDTQSVDIQFIRTGYILPDPFSKTDLQPSSPTSLFTPSYQGLTYYLYDIDNKDDYYLSIGDSTAWYDQYRANLRLGEDGVPVTEKDIKGTALYIPLSGTDLIDSGERLTGYIEVAVADDDSETAGQVSTSETTGSTTGTESNKNTTTKIVSLYAQPPETPSDTEEWMRWNASSDAPTVGGGWTLYYKDDSGEFKGYASLPNSPAIAVNGVKNYRDYGVLYQEMEVIDKRTNEDGGDEEKLTHVPLSGPSKDDFTLNLEVWQLSKLYEGNILVSYVYFNANQFEDATRRLAVELSVPDVYIQTNEGTTVDAENLYKMWVRCWYEKKSGPTSEWVIDDDEDQASSEVKFYGDDLNDSSTWLPSNKIPVLLFGKLDADTQGAADVLATTLHKNADFYMADIVANVGTGDKQTHIINAINYIDNEQNLRPASAPYYNLMGDVNCHTPVSQSPEGITQGKDENENANSDIVNIELNNENGEAAPFYGVIRFPLRERMDQVTGVVATSTGQERSNNYLKTPFFVKSKTTTGEYAPMYVSTESVETNTLAEGEAVEPTEENANAGNNTSPKVALYVRDYSGMRNVWTDYLCRRAQQPDPNVKGVDFNRFFNVQDGACAYTWGDTVLQTVEDAGNQHYTFKDVEDLDVVWYDTYADAPPLYRQWDVASTIASQENHSARARINALGFIFNIVVQNIDPDFSALGYKLTTKPRAYVYSTGNNTNKEENVDG